jgi:pimeloyl-ACP methyl ester carboxylesterase
MFFHMRQSLVKTVPYADNQGVKIHYQVEGDGAPLVLLHGLSETHEIWRLSSYVESLKKEYGLILVDARGHGDSDKPHDPKAYTMKLMASDIAAVLKDLKVNKAHFMGYSMGGWIGFGIAKYCPQHFHSIIIGGMHPYARMDQSWVKNLTVYQSAFSSDSVDTTKKLALVEEWLGPTAAKMPKCKEYAQRVLAANDWQALIALASKDWGHGFGDALPAMTMPVLLFAGEKDSFYPGVRECAKYIPNATFISFPGIDHAELEFRRDLVLPHIASFLKKATQP